MTLNSPKWSRVLFAVIVLLFALSRPDSYAGPASEHPGIGMAASLSSYQSAVLLPIWLSSKVTFTPGLTFFSNDFSGSAAALELGLRFNFSQSPAVPYFGVHGYVAPTWPKSGATETQYGGGFQLGGEYLLTEHVGLAIEGRLTIDHLPRTRGYYYERWPVSTQGSTSTRIMGIYYF